MYSPTIQFLTLPLGQSHACNALTICVMGAHVARLIRHFRRSPFGALISCKFCTEATSKKHRHLRRAATPEGWLRPPAAGTNRQRVNRYRYRILPPSKAVSLRNHKGRQLVLSAHKRTLDWHHHGQQNQFPSHQRAYNGR